MPSPPRARRPQLPAPCPPLPCPWPLATAPPPCPYVSRAILQAASLARANRRGQPGSMHCLQPVFRHQRNRQRPDLVLLTVFIFPNPARRGGVLPYDLGHCIQQNPRPEARVRRPYRKEPVAEAGNRVSTFPAPPYGRDHGSREHSHESQNHSPGHGLTAKHSVRRRALSSSRVRGSSTSIRRRASRTWARRSSTASRRLTANSVVLSYNVQLRLFISATGQPPAPRGFVPPAMTLRSPLTRGLATSGRRCNLVLEWQRLDRESRTLRGRLRIWRTERSLRELVGAVRGREDLVAGWREDLDRYHKGERAALGRAHSDSARKIEKKVREGYRRGLRDAERHARAVWGTKEREGTWGRERGRSITRILPRPPQPRGPERRRQDLGGCCQDSRCGGAISP